MQVEDTDMYGLSDETLKRLVQEVMTVAKGASAHELRMFVQQSMPKDKFSAERFMVTIRRLKLATEAMESSAMETYQVVLRDNG